MQQNTVTRKYFVNIGTVLSVPNWKLSGNTVYQVM